VIELRPLARTSRQIASTALLISCLLIGPGWHFGYRSPASYLTCWLLNTLVLLNAYVLFQRFFRSDDLYDALVRMAVLVFGLIVLCGLVLGGVGRLTSPAYAVLLTALLGLFARFKWPGRLEFSEPGSDSDISLRTAPLLDLHPAAVLVVPILVLVLCFGLTHPPVEYDSLTYHLFFPARWLQDHRISIIQTPFGEQAPAYSPSNAELFFLWLMVPFHGDLLARVGQFPFYGLTALTLYALARRLGASPPHAVYAPALFLLARPVVEQAVGANVDLVFAATFVTTVYFGLTACQTRKRSDIVLWGISFGLWLGTKFIALAFCPVLLLFGAVPGLRLRSVWALPGIAALALPWYLRNWVIAGSPLYPTSVTIAGLTVAPGAYGPGVMNNSGWQHLDDLALLPMVLQRAFGADLVVVWIPFAVLGAWWLINNRRWWPVILALPIPAALITLFWYAIPYNNAFSARYIFAAVALAMLLVPYSFRAHEKIGKLVHAGLVLGILWLVAMSREPLVGPNYLLLYGILAAVLLAYWRPVSTSLVLSVLSFGLVCAATFMYSVMSCPGAGCGLIQMVPFTRPTMFEGWDWIDRHATGATIAYTGNNIPYRLLGPHLENRVYYVNIDRHFDWRYHDYGRAERKHVDYKPPDAPNPPYPRLHGYGEAWIGNLKRAEIDYLFVSRLSPLLGDEYWRDEAGFPIEDQWAKSHPQMFALVHDNPEVKIYAVQR
jgi:hypothetical protein